jgi:hypothetical protein
MANDVFTLANDVEVAIYTYASDVFIWGVTRWDNGDKWSAGTDVEDWQVITGSIANININNGVSLEQALLRPDPATAVITFQDPQFDPFNNAQVRAGTPIRIRVRPNPDTAPTTWVTLFQGKIDTASASYNENFINTCVITCITDLRDYLNFTAADGMTVDPVSAYAWQYIAEMNNQYPGNEITYDVTQDGYLLDGMDSIDPVAFGDVVNQILDANLAALIYRPITAPNPVVPYYYMTAAEIGDINTRTTNVDFEAATSANTKRASFYDLTVGFNTEEIVSSLTYSTSLGYGPNTRKNDEAIALLGDLGLEVTTWHFNDTDADTWAGQITLGLPERRVQQISAPMLYRSGQVNEYLLREPMDVASVSANNANIYIAEQYFITRIEHNITPTSWLATFDLWKGR